jgi:hypothetical protein
MPTYIWRRISSLAPSGSGMYKFHQILTASIHRYIRYINICVQFGRGYICRRGSCSAPPNTTAFSSKDYRALSIYDKGWGHDSERESKKKELCFVSCLSFGRCSEVSRMSRRILKQSCRRPSYARFFFLTCCLPAQYIQTYHHRLTPIRRRPSMQKSYLCKTTRNRWESRSTTLPRLGFSCQAEYMK